MVQWTIAPVSGWPGTATLGFSVEPDGEAEKASSHSEPIGVRSRRLVRNAG